MVYSTLPRINDDGKQDTSPSIAPERVFYGSHGSTVHADGHHVLTIVSSIELRNHNGDAGDSWYWVLLVGLCFPLPLLLTPPQSSPNASSMSAFFVAHERFNVLNCCQLLNVRPTVVIFQSQINDSRFPKHVLIYQFIQFMVFLVEILKFSMVHR
jgi:hypothetical protein